MAKAKVAPAVRFWLVNSGGLLHECTRAMALELLKDQTNQRGGPFRLATAEEIAKLESQNGFQSGVDDSTHPLPFDPEHGGWVRDSRFDEPDKP